MFPTASLYSFALVAISFAGAVSAIPTSSGAATLAFRTRVNATGLGNIAEIDRARAAAFKSHNRRDLSRRQNDVSVTNTAVTYTASVGVGSPVTYYS
jgi:hypothetical protein